jgi:hypothetical protein
MPDDPLAPLHAAARRGRIQGLFAAALSAGLGAFMIALHALQIDPEAASMGTGAIIALYAFAGLFIITGIGLVWVALFKSSKDRAELERRLRDAPESIVLARRHVATRRGVQAGQGEADLGAHQAHVEGGDGRIFLINASPSQVSDVLRLIRARCPKAIVDGLP